MSRKRIKTNARRPTKNGGRQNRTLLWGAVIAVGILGGMGLSGLANTASKTPTAPTATSFNDVKSQTAEFHAYNRSITLSVEQKQVFREALSNIPAPCCSDRTAYTCCCQCNLARSWWGLAKHAIANQGYGIEQVRTTVEEWIAFVNPAGFSGDTCYSGGCSRPFRYNGCGGMKASNVIL